LTFKTLNVFGVLAIGISAIAAAVVVLSPEVFVAFAGRPGQVWTLFNSANYRAGDMYYYASMVQQVLWGNIPPRPPNSDFRLASPENFRWASYAIASLPGFFGFGTRTVHLFTLALPSALSMAIGMSLGLLLTKRHWPSFMSALLSTFFLQIWISLTIYPSTPSFGSILTWFTQIGSSFDTSLSATMNIYELDQLAMLRFAVPAIAYTLLAGFVFVLIALDRKKNHVLIALAIGLGSLLAFSYPPSCIVGNVVLATYAFAAVLERDWDRAKVLLSIGITIILVLALAGAPQLFLKGFESDTFISAIYGSQILKFQNISAGAALLHLAINKYTLTFGYMLYGARNSIPIRRIVTTTSVALLAFSASVLLEPSIYSRFLERGIDHLWFLLVSIVFWSELAVLVDRLRPTSGTLVKVSTALIAILVAGSGFLSLYKTNSVDARHFVPEGQWKAYEWLSQNASGQTIAALNWDDIEFIAVYHGKLKCVFGPADLANVRPEVAVLSYVSTWKELGLKRETLEAWASRSAETEFTRIQAFLNRRSTPFLTPEDFAASRIVSALVYYPYIDRFEGGPVASSDEKGWHTNPHFVDNVLRMFDQAPVNGFLDRAGVRYILLSPNEMKYLDGDRLKNFETAFRSQDRIVLMRRSSDRASP